MHERPPHVCQDYVPWLQYAGFLEDRLGQLRQKLKTAEAHLDFQTNLALTWKTKYSLEVPSLNIQRDALAGALRHIAERRFLADGDANERDQMIQVAEAALSSIPAPSTTAETCKDCEPTIGLEVPHE